MKKKVMVVLLSVLIIFTFSSALGCGGGGGDKKTTTNKPRINSIDPKSGPPGTIVLIMGKTFGEAQGDSVVHVGNEVATVLAWSDESLSITIPVDMAAADQGVSVLTGDGESNQLDFTITKAADQPPASEPKETEVENPTPASAILAFMKKKGTNTSGWSFAVVKVSAKDPNWKIDSATKTGQPTIYFLLKKVNGSWTVIDDGNAMTPQELQGDGAPSDLWVQVPTPQPQPQPKTQLQVILDYLAAQKIDSAGVSVYSYKQSAADPTWELFYIDFPVEEQRTDMIFALHQENGQWVVKGSGSGPEINNTPGLPSDLKIAQ